jgi:hypothetical protein
VRLSGHVQHWAHYFRVNWEERWIKAQYPVGKHAIKAGGEFSTRIQQRQFICARAAQKSAESRKRKQVQAHSLKIAGVGQKNVSRASIDFHANLAAIVPKPMANKTQQGRQKSQKETLILLKEISHLEISGLSQLC